MKIIRRTPVALGLIGLCASLAPALAAARPPANVCVELVNWIEQQQAKTAGKGAGMPAEGKPESAQAQAASKPPPGVHVVGHAPESSHPPTARAP